MSVGQPRLLPHDGLNISMEDLIVALNASVNLAAEGTLFVGSLALLASKTGDPATFNLDNVDEHDGEPISTSPRLSGTTLHLIHSYTRCPNVVYEFSD
jgi:hypothetical protein